MVVSLKVLWLSMTANNDLWLAGGCGKGPRKTTTAPNVLAVISICDPSWPLVSFLRDCY